MLDEKKIRVMTKLAAYEEGAGKKYFPVVAYFRGDFITMQLVKSFVCGTIAFLMVAGLLIFCNFEALLSGIYDIDLMEYGRKIGKIYVICMIVYLVGTYVWSVYKYHRAKKSIGSYVSVMDKLSKKYYE